MAVSKIWEVIQEGTLIKAVQGSVGVGNTRGTRGRWRGIPIKKIKKFFGRFDGKEQTGQ
jgi:hypothetical protein